MVVWILVQIILLMVPDDSLVRVLWFLQLLLLIFALHKLFLLLLLRCWVHVLILLILVVCLVGWVLAFPWIWLLHRHVVKWIIELVNDEFLWVFLISLSLGTLISLLRINKRLLNFLMLILIGVLLLHLLWAAWVATETGEILVKLISDFGIRWWWKLVRLCGVGSLLD